MADFDYETKEVENPIKPIKKKKGKKETKPKKEKKTKKSEPVEQEPLIDYYPEEQQEYPEDEPQYPQLIDPLAEDNPEIKAKIKRLYIKNPEAVRRIIDDVKKGRAGVDLDGLNEEQLNDIMDLARIEATSKLDRKVGTLAINKLTQAIDYKLDLDGEFSKEVEDDEILQELAGEMMSENVLSFVPKPIVFGLLYSTHAGSAYVKSARNRPKPLKPIEETKLVVVDRSGGGGNGGGGGGGKPVVVKSGETTSKDLEVF